MRYSHEKPNSSKKIHGGIKKIEENYQNQNRV